MKSLCNYILNVYIPTQLKHSEVMDCVVLFIPFHNLYMHGMEEFNNICLVSRLSTLLGP